MDEIWKGWIMWIEVKVRGKAPRCQKCGGMLLIASVEIAQPLEMYVYYTCKKCKEPHGVYSSDGILFWFKNDGKGKVNEEIKFS